MEEVVHYYEMETLFGLVFDEEVKEVVDVSEEAEDVEEKVVMFVSVWENEG